MVIPLKVGLFPGTSCSTFESNWWIVIGCFGAGPAGGPPPAPGASESRWSGPGVPGVGARCGNGPFSTYKSPKFYLNFTILVSFILVRCPDRIGLVNTVPTVP